MSGISSVSTQEVQQMNMAANAAGATQATQSGKLDNLTFQVQNGNDVDPSTKDDEVASDIKAQKDTTKAKNDKTKEKERKRINAALKKEEIQDVNEQQQQGKRIAKNTERVLQSISQFGKKDAEDSIQERSNKLFSGSEDKYDHFLKTLNQSDVLKSDEKGATWEVKKLDKATILATLNGKTFQDVAEKHNALQIVVDTWDRKLTHLLKLKHEKASTKDQSPENQNEYKNLEKQINQFEENLEAVKSVQGDLLAQNKDRIESSYSLAPLLREVSANMAQDVTLPPKTLHDLILDEVLPLNGNENKIFKCLDQSLTPLFSEKGNVKSGYGTFLDNIHRALDALRNEANKLSNNTLSAQVLGSILNTCRTIEKIENTHLLHETLVTQINHMIEQQNPKIAQ